MKPIHPSTLYQRYEKIKGEKKYIKDKNNVQTHFVLFD